LRRGWRQKIKRKGYGWKALKKVVKENPLEFTIAVLMPISIVVLMWVALFDIPYMRISVTKETVLMDYGNGTQIVVKTKTSVWNPIVVGGVEAVLCIFIAFLVYSEFLCVKLIVEEYQSWKSILERLE